MTTRTTYPTLRAAIGGLLDMRASGIRDVEWHVYRDEEGVYSVHYEPVIVIREEHFDFVERHKSVDVEGYFVGCAGGDDS